LSDVDLKPVIEIEKLNLVFQTADTPVHALSDIDLTVNAGDFVSFIGPSGCGKTTLMRVIFIGVEDFEMHNTNYTKV